MSRTPSIRQRLRRSAGAELLLGPRSRLLRLVILVGVLSGLVAAAYVGALRFMTRGLGPDRWGDLAHLVVLICAGVAIGLMTRWLGNPGDVELLVDNIHVTGG